MTPHDDRIPAKKRGRPFPWVCAECGKREVQPQSTRYETTIKHDGRTYTIVVPGLLLPTCGNCGERVFTSAADDQVVAALRSHLKLLTPDEIRGRRTQLELNQGALAEQLGVAKETISRWETGSMLQSRAMDNLLRLYFDCQQAQDYLHRLREPEPEPANGLSFWFRKVTLDVFSERRFDLSRN